VRSKASPHGGAPRAGRLRHPRGGTDDRGHAAGRCLTDAFDRRTHARGRSLRRHTRSRARGTGWVSRPRPSEPGPIAARCLADGRPRAPFRIVRRGADVFVVDRREARSTLIVRGPRPRGDGAGPRRSSTRRATAARTRTDHGRSRRWPTGTSCGRRCSPAGADGGRRPRAPPLPDQT